MALAHAGPAIASASSPPPALTGHSRLASGAPAAARACTCLGSASTSGTNTRSECASCRPVCFAVSRGHVGQANFAAGRCTRAVFCRFPDAMQCVCTNETEPSTRLQPVCNPQVPIQGLQEAGGGSKGGLHIIGLAHSRRQPHGTARRHNCWVGGQHSCPRWHTGCSSQRLSLQSTLRAVPRFHL